MKAIKEWEIKKKPLLVQQFAEWEKANDLNTFISLVEKEYSGTKSITNYECVITN